MGTPEQVRARLRRARVVRERGRQREHEALVEIAKALTDGHGLGLAMSEMAKLAGISRQTAYTLLRREKKGSAV